MTELQRQKNKEAVKKYQQKNKEKIKKQKAEYYAKEKKKILSIAMAKRKGLKEMLYNLYGHACSMCGFDDKRALSVDHVNNDGYLERKSGIGSGNPTYLKAIKQHGNGRYQILCMNCQWIKRNSKTEL